MYVTLYSLMLVKEKIRDKEFVVNNTLDNIKSGEGNIHDIQETSNQLITEIHKKKCGMVFILIARIILQKMNRCVNYHTGDLSMCIYMSNSST